MSATVVEEIRLLKSSTRCLRVFLVHLHSSSSEERKQVSLDRATRSETDLCDSDCLAIRLVSALLADALLKLTACDRILYYGWVCSSTFQGVSSLTTAHTVLPYADPATQHSGRFIVRLVDQTCQQQLNIAQCIAVVPINR